MKKFTLSVVAVMAMSTFAIAGGDVKDVEPAVEPVVEVVAPVVDDSSFYVGLGYSYMNINEKWPYATTEGSGEQDLNGNALTVLAGYNFNKYIAVEGRYSITLGDMTAEFVEGDETDIDAELSNIALYLKPMYPVGELTLYGLLGFGKVTLEAPNGEEFSESGFQWGLGAGYAVTEDVGVFVDYTRLYDDKGFDNFSEVQDRDFVIDSINVGVTYKF